MTSRIDPRRGEFWLLQLDPTVGSEQAKTRPVLVVSADGIGRLPLRIILPVTSWKDRYAELPWMVRVRADRRSGLDRESAADGFQVRSVSLERFVHRLGRADDPVMREAAAAVALCVDYEG